MYVDNSSRNDTLQQFLMHTQAHTIIYATKFSISESCNPLAVRWFVARLVTCTCSLALLTNFSPEKKIQA